MDSCTWHKHVGFNIFQVPGGTTRNYHAWTPTPRRNSKPSKLTPRCSTLAICSVMSSQTSVKYGGIPVIRNRKCHCNMFLIAGILPFFGSDFWYKVHPLTLCFCQPVEGSVKKLLSFTNQPCQHQTSAWCSSATIMEDSSWKHAGARDTGGKQWRDPAPFKSC